MTVNKLDICFEVRQKVAKPVSRLQLTELRNSKKSKEKESIWKRKKHMQAYRANITLNKLRINVRSANGEATLNQR